MLGPRRVSKGAHLGSEEQLVPVLGPHPWTECALPHVVPRIQAVKPLGLSSHHPRKGSYSILALVKDQS